MQPGGRFWHSDGSDDSSSNDKDSASESGSWHLSEEEANSQHSDSDQERGLSESNSGSGPDETSAAQSNRQGAHLLTKSMSTTSSPNATQQHEQVVRSDNTYIAPVLAEKRLLDLVNFGFQSDKNYSGKRHRYFTKKLCLIS